MRLRNLFAITLTLSGVAAAPLVGALPVAPPPQIELYISGSSAQDEALENLVRLSADIAGAPALCEPGTLDIYRGSLGGTANRVFYCRTSHAVSGVRAGLRLAIYKSSGGSGDGVTPVAAATPLPFLDLARLPQRPTCQSGKTGRVTAVKVYNSTPLF